MGMKPERRIAPCQQSPKFGGPKLRERKPEDSQGVTRQIRFNRKPQERNQHRRGNWPAHQSRRREAAHQEKRTERIDDVVHLKPIPRPLPAPDPRERSIQAVAEPIEREEESGEQQPARIPPRHRIACCRKQHRRKPQQRQMIGTDPLRQSRRHPQQTLSSPLRPSRFPEFAPRPRTRYPACGLQQRALLQSPRGIARQMLERSGGQISSFNGDWKAASSPPRGLPSV